MIGIGSVRRSTKGSTYEEHNAISTPSYFTDLDKRMVFNECVALNTACISATSAATRKCYSSSKINTL